MAIIPESEMTKLIQESSELLSSIDYDSDEYKLMIQAAVDEFLKTAFRNGVENKMTSANAQYTPPQAVMDILYTQALKEAARQV